MAVGEELGLTAELPLFNLTLYQPSINPLLRLY